MWARRSKLWVAWLPIGASLRNGLPSVTICRTHSGWFRPSPRANIPPRLHPTRLTGVPAESARRRRRCSHPLEDLGGRTDVASQAPPTGFVAEGAEVGAQDEGRTVVGQEAGEDQHRVAIAARGPAEQRDAHDEGSELRRGPTWLGEEERTRRRTLQRDVLHIVAYPLPSNPGRSRRPVRPTRICDVNQCTGNPRPARCVATATRVLARHLPTGQFRSLAFGFRPHRQLLHAENMRPQISSVTSDEDA